MDSQSPTAVDTVRKVCRDGPLSDTVISAVTEATGIDPLDLPPLYRVVDPDMLDRVGRSQAATPSALEIRFRWAGSHVSVRADGEVLVRPPTAVVGPPTGRLGSDR